MLQLCLKQPSRVAAEKHQSLFFQWMMKSKTKDIFNISSDHWWMVKLNHIPTGCISVWWFSLLASSTAL